MKKKQGYYTLIPAEVRYDNNLSAQAKLLYGEIYTLANKKGYCWASNKYFAILYATTTRSVTRWVGELINYGYISCREENNKRHIFLKSSFGYGDAVKRLNKAVDKKVYGSIDKNVQHNNTRNNMRPPALAGESCPRLQADEQEQTAARPVEQVVHLGDPTSVGRSQVMQALDEADRKESSSN